MNERAALEADREFIATRLCTSHQSSTPTRMPCAACTQEVDSLVAASTRDNADLLIAMWHNMKFDHPYKDGMRHASTILYNLAHVLHEHTLPPQGVACFDHREVGVVRDCPTCDTAEGGGHSDA